MRLREAVRGNAVARARPFVRSGWPCLDTDRSGPRQAGARNSRPRSAEKRLRFWRLRAGKI
jgi:hypothetical protein